MRETCKWPSSVNSASSTAIAVLVSASAWHALPPQNPISNANATGGHPIVTGDVPTNAVFSAISSPCCPSSSLLRRPCGVRRVLTRCRHRHPGGWGRMRRLQSGGGGKRRDPTSAVSAISRNCLDRPCLILLSRIMPYRPGEPLAEKGTISCQFGHQHGDGDLTSLQSSAVPADHVLGSPAKRGQHCHSDVSEV